jgi:ketosteroid isomerase-like protein
VSARNVEIVREVYAGWGRGDLAAEVECFDRYVLLVQRREFPDSGPYLGPQAIRGYMRNQFADFDDARIAGEEYMDAGDTVVVRVRQTAAGAGTDLPAELSYYQVWTLRAGSVLRIESIMEREDALAAAGVTE